MPNKSDKIVPSNRTEELHIRLTKSEIADLRKIATHKGLPLSTWARMILVGTANTVLGD